MSDAFFHPDGDRFTATVATRGPWSPDHQHAGPPSALIGGAVERAAGGEGKRVGRITFEILRPVAITTFELDVEVVRPGKRVDLVEAILRDEDGEVMLARAWRLAFAEIDLPDVPDPSPPPPGPDEGEHTPFFDTGEDVGYHTAMDWRFVAGGFNDPGPATAWMRPRVPIVAGEDISPLQRVLVAADSGNGISAALNPRRHLFINTDLTVHLHRHPETEWICLDASTTLNGTTIAAVGTDLYDQHRHLGRAMQTLVIAER